MSASICPVDMRPQQMDPIRALVSTLSRLCRYRAKGGCAANLLKFLGPRPDPAGEAGHMEQFHRPPKKLSLDI